MATPTHLPSHRALTSALTILALTFVSQAEAQVLAPLPASAADRTKSVPATAQTVTTFSGGAEERVDLSPFVVRESASTGYLATDSLAGTRLRTPLKDIGASISVITRDMIDDLAVANVEDLLVYTTGTEVVGIGGNFSDSRVNSGAQDFEAVRENASPNTRVRGLAGADQTRNFFLNKAIPLDSYNTSSVTINRGANSILFGFGSPAGIIENSLLAPQFHDAAQARFSLGSYDSYRASLDWEKVLVRDKLSIRLVTLNDDRRYEQRSTFRDQKRYYGAVTFRPFKSTSLRVNAEKGYLDQRLPRVDPPIDSLSSWWWYGKPTRGNDFTAGRIISPSRGVETTYQRNNNLDGMAGNWQQNPGLIYYDVNDTLPSDVVVPYARVQNGNTVTTTYRFLAPRNDQEIAADVNKTPLAGFSVAKQIIDRSIFDYRTEMLDGPNNLTWCDFTTHNVTLEQLFLGGAAGIEASYDSQKSTSSTMRTISTKRGNNIFIDVNTVTIDGRPNPNFGRPFMGANGYYNKDDNRLETFRATAYLKHDFARQRWGFLSRLLGRHTVTGMYSHYEREQDYHSGYNAAVDPSWLDGLNANTLATSRKISAIVYLGPSLAGASSPTGSHLQGVRNTLIIPSSVNIMNLNRTTNYQWARQTVSTYNYLGDEAYLANSVVYNHNEVKSKVGVWQGYWMDDTLVSTVGFRRDSDVTESGSAAGFNEKGARALVRPDPTRSNGTDSDTLSYGFALHAPRRLLRWAPEGTEFSLYWNSSENYDVAAGVRRDILGNFIDPQRGNNKEIGARISTLRNRASLRVTWYETTQDNMTDTRITSSLPWVATLEQHIVEAVPKATLDRAGYVAFDSASASLLFKRYLDFYNFRSLATLANGTRDVTYAEPGSVSDVTRSVSKGCEIEGVFNPTKNWRLAFNVAQQKATRGDTSPNLVALMDDRLPEWRKIWDLDVSTVNTVGAEAARNIVNPVNTARLSNGERVPELREWRVNLLANYSFARGSRLKGWGVGGAWRWEDAQVIGYPVINDKVLGLVTDAHHPFMGPTQQNVDAWISFSRKFRFVDWRVQFNVRNLLNKNLLVPVEANPVNVGDIKTFDVAAYRIGAGRRYEMTTTFKF